MFFLGVCKDPFDELLFRYDHAVADAQSTIPTEPTTPGEPTTPAAPAAAGTYTVKKGDTYGTIALNNYGTYGVWGELYKANRVQS